MHMPLFYWPHLSLSTLYSPGSQWIIQTIDVIPPHHLIPTLFNLPSHFMYSSQCTLLCIYVFYFWCQLSAWRLYLLASPLPSFPSLVIFYTTSDRKLGGDGCLGTRLCSNYEVILHILYIHEHGPQAPVLEHELSIHQAQFAGSSLSIYMHRCMVILASFPCSPYTKLTGMDQGMRLWLSPFSHMHVFRFCCQFKAVFMLATPVAKSGRWHGLRYSKILQLSCRQCD